MNTRLFPLLLFSSRSQCVLPISLVRTFWIYSGKRGRTLETSIDGSNPSAFIVSLMDLLGKVTFLDHIGDVPIEFYYVYDVKDCGTFRQNQWNFDSQHR